MSDEKLHERTEDELKSEICETVKELLEYELFDYVYEGHIVEELPSIDEDTIIELLNKLVYCDDKLVKRIDMFGSPVYMPR